ncbi:FecR domain-containing protein [Desulfurobacterium sp.]
MKRIAVALTVLISLLITNARAGQDAGTIVRIEGTVKLFQGNRLKGKTIKNTPSSIPFKSSVKTYRKSKAFLILGEKTRIILLERSLLTIENACNINQSSGTVLYKVKKLGKVSGIAVKTPVSIIGVKGTMFAVAVNKKTANIFLKTGTLSIESLQKQFEVYKIKTAGEFENFKQEFQKYQNATMKEFEKFKQETEKEFLFYTKKFTLPAGKSVSIRGNKVYILETIPKEIDRKFKLFTEYGGAQ